MFGRSYSSTQLKLQLKLAISRLKILQNKKNHLGQQTRRDVAVLLEKGKEESARIKVEHIIREDFAIEALEILELYCDLLLARFGLIDEMDECDPAISEAVNTLIYAAPRCEVKEILETREIFTLKYGKEFCRNAMENKNDVVNPRIVQKLKVQTPDPFLVNQYLKEIARSFNLPWEGDITALDTDDFVIDDLMDDNHFDDDKEEEEEKPVAPKKVSIPKKLPSKKITIKQRDSEKDEDIKKAFGELFPQAPSTNVDQLGRHIHHGVDYDDQYDENSSGTDRGDDHDHEDDSYDSESPQEEIAPRRKHSKDHTPHVCHCKGKELDNSSRSPAHHPSRDKGGSSKTTHETDDTDEDDELEELSRKFNDLKNRRL